MDPSVASGLAGLSLFAVLFMFVLAVLWILVPFAIFGIKPLLRQIGSEVFRMNTLLEQVQKELQAQNSRNREITPQ